MPGHTTVFLCFRVSEYLSFRALTEHSRAACTAELAFTVVLAQGSLTLLEVILLIRGT